MAMKSAVVAAGACLALVGCSSAPVDDRPVVHIAPAAQPSAAIALAGFLPSAEQLGQTLETGPNGFMGAVVEGGPEILLRSVSDAQAVPADCAGTPYRLQEVVYRDSPVLSVASTSWSGGGFDLAPVSGYVGVVQMGSPSAAQGFFATTTDRWLRCNGETVALQRPGPGAGELTRITDVVFADDVVSATVLHVSAGAQSPTSLRAIGVSGDCIVDVEVLDPRPGADLRGAVAITDLVLATLAARR